MRLQKFAYFGHGWFLALTDQALISDRIEAWQFGPVVPTLYQAFKGYGDEPIESPMPDSVWSNGRWDIVVPLLTNMGPEAEKARSIIKRVWLEYKKYSTAQLSNATHQPGTPWADVYKPGIKHLVIPDEIIKAYFRRLAHATYR